jgi:hypothetical protein
MAEKLNHRQVVSFEELLMSQVVSQKALIGIRFEKRIFTKDKLGLE